MRTYYPTGEEELSPIAHELAAQAEKSAGESARIITLSGELGSGKTSFVKAFAAVMGITEQITSPTFTLMHSFPLTDSVYQMLYHLDLYRLSHHSETQEMGVQELLRDSSLLILIEWPERIAPLLEAYPHTALYFSHFAPDRRQIDIVSLQE
jgi:tRNA threonylcarbamoyladenosine biosynthesis protein TsaE